MRVLVVDENRARAALLRDGLERAGHEVAAEIPSALELRAAVERFKPDLIVIDTVTPSREALEQLHALSGERPHPIVMFASDAETQTIRAALQAGVSAYIVDGLEPDRIKPIVDVAVMRFEAHRTLREQLAEATLKLNERKLVERAKGLLMKTRGISEDEAYAELRALAMRRGKRLGEVAGHLIDAASLLG